MFERILIPIDKDSVSEHTAKLGLEFAKRLNAKVVLVYALIDFVPNDFGHEVLEPFRIRAEGLGLTVQTRVADGYTKSIGDAIVFEAEQNGCDLIFMGTHGRSGITRLLLGSVSERVARVSKIPVMLCRGEVGLTKVNRVLVPVDGSPPSARALELALKFSNTFDSALHLVHVVPDVPLPIGDPVGAYTTYDHVGLAQAFEEVGKDALEDAVKTAEERHPTSSLLRADGQSVAKVIINAATQHHADLIIMGTHGRGGFDRLLLGSVAEGVTHQANVPVLLVRG
jgi:nucleotide-binding universal stress UspA family protein